MCKENIEISKTKITLQWLNRISGALVLIPIESTPKGVNMSSANLMSNNMKLKNFTVIKFITSDIQRVNSNFR